MNDWHSAAVSEIPKLLAMDITEKNAAFLADCLIIRELGGFATPKSETNEPMQVDASQKQVDASQKQVESCQCKLPENIANYVSILERSLGEYIRTRTECQEHPTERKCNEEHRCFGGVLYAVEKIMTTLRAVADDDEQRQLCEFVDSLVKKP